MVLNNISLNENEELIKITEEEEKRGVRAVECDRGHIHKVQAIAELSLPYRCSYNEGVR